MGGSELSDHLLQAKKQLGQEPKDAGKDEAEEWEWSFRQNAGCVWFPDQLPICAEHIWETFLDLHFSRSNSGYGPLPLSLVDVRAWGDINGFPLTPFEVSAIRRLDAIYIEVNGEDKKNGKYS